MILTDFDLYVQNKIQFLKINQKYIINLKPTKIFDFLIIKNKNAKPYKIL